VGRVDESTPTRATCLYSIGKLAALELIRYYRHHHGVAAANLILFNHESPRRAAEYFLPTVAAGLTRAFVDRTHRFQVKTLDFWMDWASAEELMDIAVDISERSPSEDFVMASGTTVHARRVVQEWFARNGLDYTKHVEEQIPAQSSVPGFEVILDRLRSRVGRKPVRTVESIVDELAHPAKR
jgi:GDPmannose 4,6-dehydratase